jgi:hypothetical protein
MRILLFCPTHRLERETINSIHGLIVPGGVGLDVMFTRDNPHGDGSGQNIIYNYQKAERIVKAESYDYLFTVENDVIVPPDALVKLLAVDADIVHGVYGFRRGKAVLNIMRHDDTRESYSLAGNLRAWKKAFGKVIPCNGLGLGCTLIKRSVFDVLTFHSDLGYDGDTQLRNDAVKAGLSIMADTSVLCGHKRPDGTVIWPCADGLREVGKRKPLPTREIIPNQGIAFWNENDVAIVMKAGETHAIDIDNAGVFVSAGMAEYA